MLTVASREALGRAAARSLRDGGRVLVAGPYARQLRPYVRRAIIDAGKRARAVNTIGPHMGLMMALPFKDQLFDVVVCTREFGDAVLQARELVRVTLPGGTICVLSGEVPRRKLEMELERLECDVWQYGAVIARTPGPRTGGMRIKVEDLRGWTPERVRRVLKDLPVARGYKVIVKPLHYRKRPHVQAFCEFDERQITIQVPMPFEPFWEDVPYRAKRLHAKGLKFKWYVHRVWFEHPAELIRYLYLHEYYHWYLRESLGRKSGAETACDRFAIQRLF